MSSNGEKGKDMKDRHSEKRMEKIEIETHGKHIHTIPIKGNIPIIREVFL